jgi:hypothetical protein
MSLGLLVFFGGMALHYSILVLVGAIALVVLMVVALRNF